MAKINLAEGSLKLTLDDKTVKKNLESLKKVESKLEIDSNIEDIMGKFDKLSDVESEVDFKSNIDDIIKDIEGIQKTSAELDIDSNFDDIKSQLDSIRNGNVNLDSNADDIRSQIAKIKGDLAEKQMIKAEVDVDQTEFKQFKEDISQKFTIKAAITAAGAAVGESTAVEYNDVVKMMKERGLSEDTANDIIKTGLDNGYSLQEIAETTMYSNKATMELMAENRENAKEIIAAFVAAERAGAAGADDLSRMISELKGQGFSDDEVMGVLSQVTQRGIENLNTENAEAIREFLPKMKGFEDQEVTQKQYVNVVSQMDISSADMAGQIGDALYQIALNTQGQDFNEVLENVRSGSYEDSDEALSELGIDREKYHQLQNYLEGVNLDANLSDSRDYLESIASVSEDQRSYLETIIQEIQKLGVESGFMKNAGDIFAGIGGMDLVKDALATGGALEFLKPGFIGKILNTIRGLGTATEAGAAGTAAAEGAGFGAEATAGLRAGTQLLGKAALPLAILSAGVELELMIDKRKAEIAAQDSIDQMDLDEPLQLKTNPTTINEALNYSTFGTPDLDELQEAIKANKEEIQSEIDNLTTENISVNNPVEVSVENPVTLKLNETVTIEGNDTEIDISNFENPDLLKIVNEIKNSSQDLEVENPVNLAVKNMVNVTGETEIDTASFENPDLSEIIRDIKDGSKDMEIEKPITITVKNQVNVTDDTQITPQDYAETTDLSNIVNELQESLKIDVEKPITITVKNTVDIEEETEVNPWMSTITELKESLQKMWEETRITFKEQISAVDLGSDMMKDFAEGIKNGSTWVNEALQEVIDDVKQQLQSTYALTSSSISGGASSSAWEAYEQAKAEGKITTINYTDNSSYEVSQDVDIVDATKAKKETLNSIYNGEF